MSNLDVIAALLREGGNVKIKVRGNSMRPYLIHERDYAVLRKQDSVRVGDSVLAEISPSHYVLHRLVGIDGNWVTLQGDGNIMTEHCGIEDICGTVVGFYRKGSNKMETLDNLRYRWYSYFWMHTVPIRRYLLFVHNLLFHSVKNLQ